jgi:hypothetical protein
MSRQPSPQAAGPDADADDQDGDHGDRDDVPGERRQARGVEVWDEAALQRQRRFSRPTRTQRVVRPSQLTPTVRWLQAPLPASRRPRSTSRPRTGRAQRGVGILAIAQRAAVLVERSAEGGHLVLCLSVLL